MCWGRAILHIHEPCGVRALREGKFLTFSFDFGRVCLYLYYAAVNQFNKFYTHYVDIRLILSLFLCHQSDWCNLCLLIKTEKRKNSINTLFNFLGLFPCYRSQESICNYSAPQRSYSKERWWWIQQGRIWPTSRIISLCLQWEGNFHILVFKDGTIDIIPKDLN